MAKEKNIHAEIIKRAWKDPVFKARFLKNPKEVFKEMGIDIPAGVKVHVAEDRPDHLTFVLPPSPGSYNALSDQELEKVAGGLCQKGVKEASAAALASAVVNCPTDYLDLMIAGRPPR